MFIKAAVSADGVVAPSGVDVTIETVISPVMRFRPKLVNNSGNDVFFVMTEDPALATSLMETFTSNVTDAGTTLERTFS